MEYIHTRTIKKANAVVRVFSPVLEAEERTRRMEMIHKAAAEVIKEKMKGK